jgi:serine/threonine protein kinase
MVAPPESVAAALQEGASLAPGYEAIEHLRRGRDCDVYDAWSEERDCRCVVKALRPERRDHPPARKRLRDEGRLLLALSHPHIVRAYELLERPDPILILETAEGETVEHLALRRRRRRLSGTDLAFLGLHLCAGMQYLHRKGFVHLDLKPSNVICDRGQAKVIDLSLARHPGRGAKGVGTPRYMAPEQALGEWVGPKTDVWGIGVVLYEAATASPPPAGGAGDRLNGAAASPVTPSVRRVRRLPRELVESIDACLQQDPAARPDVMEVSARLDRVAMRAEAAEEQEGREAAHAEGGS